MTVPTTLTLRTPRFVLSAIGASDIDAIHAACQDPELQQYTTVPVPYTVDEARAFATEYAPQAWRDGAEYVFGIRPEATAPLIGVVSWQRERGFVGYWLDAHHRGRGVMTEALRGLVDWVLHQDGVDLVRWEAYAGNVGSAVAARRAGFRWSGEGPCEITDRQGQHPWGWHATLQRDDLATVQPASDWPVFA